jgi:hypothetical protein
MSKRQLKTSYWQDAPLPRTQLVLIADTLESRIPEDHPVRLIDELLAQLDWSVWEAEYHGRAGQPPIHPAVMCKVLLFALIRRIRSSRQIDAAMSNLETNDTLENLFEDGQEADHLPGDLREMKARQEQLRQALGQLREMEQQRKHDGIDPKKNPAQLPATDSDSRILPNKEGGYAANYTPMAVAETENGFIVGADVLIGNAEHLAMMPMIGTMEQDYGQLPDTVMGDGTYGTGPNLAAMEERGIELLSPPTREEKPDNPALRVDFTQPVAAEDIEHLPINAQTKCFDKHAFVYVEESDCFYCPAGKPLPREGVEKVRRYGMTIEQINYRGHECAGCSLGSHCRKTPDARMGRKVTRDGFEAVRRRHSERMRQDAAKTRYKRRQHYGETPFAVLKAVLGMRRFLLRGIDAVKQEWLWASYSSVRRKNGFVPSRRRSIH